jgi:hypothetical protein
MYEKGMVIQGTWVANAGRPAGGVGMRGIPEWLTRGTRIGVDMFGLLSFLNVRHREESDTSS